MGTGSPIGLAPKPPSWAAARPFPARPASATATATISTTRRIRSSHRGTAATARASPRRGGIVSPKTPEDTGGARAGTTLSNAERTGRPHRPPRFALRRIDTHDGSVTATRRLALRGRLGLVGGGHILVVGIVRVVGAGVRACVVRRVLVVGHGVLVGGSVLVA